MKPPMLFIFSLLSISFFSFQPSPQQNKLPDRSAVIVDFQVKRLSGSRILLTWHTQPEQKGNGFEVERRLGKDAEFTTVGFVPAKPYTNADGALVDYAFTDIANAHPDSSYYRLKQKDEKGTYYSYRTSVPGISSTRH